MVQDVAAPFNQSPAPFFRPARRLRCGVARVELAVARRTRPGEPGEAKASPRACGKVPRWAGRGRLAGWSEPQAPAVASSDGGGPTDSDRLPIPCAGSARSGGPADPSRCTSGCFTKSLRSRMSSSPH